MTIAQVSFRDFIRGATPADVLELRDKKSNKTKGLFISPEYAEEVLEMIKAAEKKRRDKRTKKLMTFAGMLGEIEEADRSHIKIKASRYE